MQILITGVSGYVGAALAPRLRAEGHRVRGFTRARARVRAEVDELVEGDAVAGTGLEAALEGIEVAYYLIHSMESAVLDFATQERRAAESFAAAAQRAGVARIVYLGGLVPPKGPRSPHLASRLAVEETLLSAVPGSIALRASIVIGARSRSFRFLVRLIERLPVLALPAWREHETQPVDGRDMLAFLTRAAVAPAALAGRSWDVVGPDRMTYAQLIAALAEAMMVTRPQITLDLGFPALTSVLAAAVAGEDPGLVGPLMESLETPLLPRDDEAAGAFGVRRHSFAAAVERALRDWEHEEELAAR